MRRNILKVVKIQKQQLQLFKQPKYGFFDKITKFVERKKQEREERAKQEEEEKRRQRVDLKEKLFDFSESLNLSPFVNNIKLENIKKPKLLGEKEEKNISNEGDLPLTLVLELEGVLYFTFYPDEDDGYMSQPLTKYDKYVEFDDEQGQVQLVSVYWRPALWEFLEYLRNNQDWLEVVVFTSGSKEYTQTMLNLIDPEQTIFNRNLVLCQDKCDRLEIEEEDIDYLVKDLQLLNRNLDRTIYIDCHPFSYWLYPDNCVPILDWVPEIDNQVTDNALTTTIEQLEDLRRQKDVKQHLYQEFNLREILSEFKIV